MKRAVIPLIILILSGCCSSGNSPDYITYYLNRGYDGSPINQFFIDYGYPAGLFEQAGNKRVYRWVSTQYTRQYKGDPKQTTSDRFASNNKNYQSIDTYHGITERQYCEIRIYTDAADIIKDFSVAVDSTGKWSASRCSEIFSNTYPQSTIFTIP